MNFSNIIKSGCFHTVPNTVRLKRTLSPPAQFLRLIHSSSLVMHPKNFYKTPVKVLKVSQQATPQSCKIDVADLEALEGSFSEDAQEGSSLIITKVAKPPATQSPVKPHNRQFENDFEIDLSEEEEDLQSGKENIEPASKLTTMVREFSSSPTMHRSIEKIKISQLNRTLDKKPLPKLTRVSFDSDFEDSLEDGFEKLLAEPAKQLKKEEIPSQAQPTHTASSAHASSTVFTSSPSYHKYETLKKRMPDPTSPTRNAEARAPEHAQGTNLKHPMILDSFDENAVDDPFPSLSGEDPQNDLYPQLPPVHSTPKEGKGLYPSMESYNNQYDIKIPSLVEKDKPRGFFDTLKGKDDQKERDAKEKQPSGFFELLKSKNNGNEQTVKNEQKSRNFFDTPRFKEPKLRRDATPRTPSIPNLLNKPKKRNAELLLLTQRPQIHEMDQVRSASTISTNSLAQPNKTVQTLSLSEEQQHVVDLAKQGISLFYTGSAGTGKSVLLRSMIKTLKKMHPPESVCVTASTGLAACNIGGITLHSFAGIGLGKDSVTDLVKKVRRAKKSANRWRNVKVLVIDEISMIDGELFDKLDEIAKRIRKCDEPFGGIQVVVCGDFFQLPPVSKRDEKPATFAFDSSAWKQCIKLTITLQQVFRQKGDMEFITMLNEMRLGKLSYDSIKKFRALERELPQDDIEPAELFCTRFEVEKANKTRLDKLKTPIKTYVAFDGGTLTDPQQRDKLLANFMAPARLHLKKGAQVMMIKNIDDSLVNGSLGKVIDFIDQETYLTYEKVSENLNLDNSEIEKDIEKVKQEAQTKVKAEQEVTEGKLEDTVFDFLNEIDSNDPEVQRNIEMKKELMNELHVSSRGRKLPLVKFTTPEGQTRYVLVHPETWEVEDEREQPLVKRMQIPLILAWALSIHKSQGQTLPKVRVNLKRVFEKGQAYVALSRAVNRDGLQVLHFDAGKVEAHKRVIEFYGQLKSAQDAKKMFEGQRKSHDLYQEEIDSAMSGSIEDLECELGEEQFVDAPSPSSFAENGNFIPLITTQDDSSDNIVLNRRNFKKRSSEYL